MQTQIDEGPWYKQFWAWFILTPLIVVIIAGTSMVVIAFQQKQDIVEDDYYTVGKMINQRFDAQEQAKKLGVQAKITFDNKASQIVLFASANDSVIDSSLILNLSHPVDAAQDKYVTLKKSAHGQWLGSLNEVPEGRWYLRLSSIDDAGAELWRMQGELDFSHTQHAVLY